MISGIVCEICFRLLKNSGIDTVISRDGICAKRNGSADKTILDKLHNIRADELEHIEILKSILEKL